MYFDLSCPCFWIRQIKHIEHLLRRQYVLHLWALSVCLADDFVSLLQVAVSLPLFQITSCLSIPYGPHPAQRLPVTRSVHMVARML